MLEDTLRAQLNREKFPVLTILQSVNSTNTYLLEQPQTHGHVCLALQQTQGRGRQGRFWVSPKARNIYLSLLWEIPRVNISGLSLAVGMGVAQALHELNLPNIQLKWPNDIIYQKKKLGGILIEVRERKMESIWVVIGVGINVEMPSEIQIDQPWIDIARINVKTAELSRSFIVVNILNHLYEKLHLFADKGISAMQHEWRTWDGLYGQTIKVHHSGKIIMGVARGINSQGELLLLSHNEMISINSGEILNVRSV